MYESEKAIMPQFYSFLFLQIVSSLQLPLRHISYAKGNPVMARAFAYVCV